VAWLTAGFASRFLAKGLGGRFVQSIGRGRLAAVAAVERQAIFERLDLLAHLDQLDLQSEHQIHQHRQTGPGHLPELFASAHAHKSRRKVLLNG